MLELVLHAQLLVEYLQLLGYVLFYLLVDFDVFVKVAVLLLAVGAFRLVNHREQTAVNALIYENLVGQVLLLESVELG